MRALNVGCGARFHPDWENVDFVPAHPSVKPFDVRQGIPYEDETFDVVYHSHLMEHFSKQAAPSFLRECFRVLKSGGVIRIAVPDLERIARLYLEALEKASRGLVGWDRNYEWMVLEMYDQTVREKSGGGCAEYFRQRPIPNWDFIYERMGAWAQLLEQTSQGDSASGAARNVSLRRNWAHILRSPGRVIRKAWIRAMLGPEDWNHLQNGRFRACGEVHMWMYDSYSLARLLAAVGFSDSKRLGAAQSRILNWKDFHLDTEPNGSVYKADSLYMEAVKP
jgi:ubiquinone/menaquinone biosynthesis C-methylase UbiE